MPSTRRRLAEHFGVGLPLDEATLWTFLRYRIQQKLLIQIGGSWDSAADGHRGEAFNAVSRSNSPRRVWGDNDKFEKRACGNPQHS